MEANLLVPLALILVLGVLGQWIANRLHIPSILVLLIAGLLAGPVTGWINPDKMFGGLLFPLVSLAVSIVLFEGGLSLRLSELHAERLVAHRLRGRILFGPDINFSFLDKQFRDGMDIRAIPFTEKLTEGEIAGLFGAKVVKMFVVGSRGQLAVFTADLEPPVAPGDTLVALVDRESPPVGQVNAAQPLSQP